MWTTLRALLVAMFAAGALSGCGAILAGTAGGVAGSELEEDDGEFDPGENTEAGEAVEDGVDAAGDAIEDGADAVEDALD
ncbi:MAG: hypothetical protein ACFBWO_02015 [Paracoccaceae bacterium]